MKKILVVTVVVLFFFTVLAFASDEEKTTPKEGITPAKADTLKKPVEKPKSKPMNPVVVIEVAKFGNIEVELFTKETPKTADNFLKLVNKGFYNGLTFHRIVPGFVIQGGDPKGDGSGDPGYSIPFEKAETKHLRGYLGMARSQDPNSAGCQFYISLKDLPPLDGKYVVFGKVIKGMEVVDKIALVQTGPNDMPTEKVIMTKVYQKTSAKKK
jgi:peptidyl-prolyl cis-trans isomerase B (cyclophilin B)